MNLKVFIIVKHVKWCTPTRAVFQKIYFSRLKRVISTICIVYHFFLKHLSGPESDWLIPCPPAVLIFPSRPRRILHLSIDLRERLNDVNIVTSDSHLWIQTAKAIKRQRILSSRKKNLLQDKENYHEIQTAAEMSNIFRVPLENISLSFRKKLFFTSLGRSLLGKTVPSVLSTTLGHSFFPIRSFRLMNNVYLFI